MADTYIKISELEETTLADDSSYIPIDNGNHTYKISVENYNSGANATAQSYAEAAAASADDAETAKTAAETAETETGLIRAATQQYATAASGSASAAASSAVDALNYSDSAASAAANAADSAQDAAESYTNAAAKAVLSESWAVGGTNTRTGEDTNNSQYYAAVATSAAENAEDQVELANAASTAASGSAVDAAASATEASGYADDASDYATAASGSATAAATSATQSANSAGAAATSATNAAASATAASGSASTATTQANNAAQSATTAGGYATQAASSASDASGYATNAANSATAAAGSATTASNQATAAAGSATAAASSASDAADSAADAAESAATFTTDDTLSVAGKAADAKAAGDMIAAVQAEIPELDNWLTTPGAAAEAKHTGDRISEVEDDVADLKSAIGAEKVSYSQNGFINVTNGYFNSNADYRATDYIDCDSETSIYINGIYAGASVAAYAFYNEQKAYISGQNNISTTTVVTSIPSGAKFVRLSSRVSQGEVPVGIVSTYKSYLKNYRNLLTEMGKKLSVVTPEDTTFFERINYFKPEQTTYYTDRYCDNNGKITSGTSPKSISFAVDPSTSYILYIPPTWNRGVVAESATNVFDVGTTLTAIYTTGHPADNTIEFTTGATAKYVFVYFNSGTYDYDTNKSGIVLNKNKYTGTEPPTIINKYLPFDVRNPFSGKQLLIFGDSITDTCNFTINASDETTAYSWRNPSNSYTPPGGSTISYSMWPKILKESQDFAEIRNYARSGAQYKTASRDSGEERQNLQYQITVALNDKNNPNDVFEIDNFIPDIVIFALGTNDGAPADTFDTAMAATVYQTDGVSIDVDATISALDDTKTIASARKAFLRIKKAFPMAQIYCVLPIQRANNDTNWGTLRQYLSEMAKRNGCIIIDGTAESGITREFNVWDAVGEYLKDGLHPNEKGQNMMARMILTALKSHYIPFGTGFNPMS